MKAGDLVRNKATGDLAIVARRGEGDLDLWVSLIPMKNSALGQDIIYLAEYFEVISENEIGARKL